MHQSANGGRQAARSGERALDNGQWAGGGCWGKPPGPSPHKPKRGEMEVNETPAAGGDVNEETVG